MAWITNPQTMRVRNAAKAQVRKDVAKIQAQVERDIAANYHLLWLLALRDEYGFSYDRLVRVLNRATRNAEAVGEGYLSFEDIRQTLREETKMEV